MSDEIKRLTTSALLCALSLVVLITGILPGAIYISINISIWVVSITKRLYGTKNWILCYIVASLLSLMLIPDLEVSLTCVCMGWYPLVRNIFSDKNKYIQIVSKTIIFAIASTIIYYISIAVFGGEELTEGIPFFIVFYIMIFVALFWVLNLTMLILDKWVLKRILSILNK